MVSLQGLTVGQVAERSGIAVSAVHFYEEKGLISSWRNNANHRRYSAAVLRKIAVIKAAQKLGVSLKEIKAAMDQLPNEKKISAADWAKLSTWWQQDLDNRIAELQDLRAGLDECIGCGCLSLTDCHLLNPEDKLGSDGAGAHLLGWRRKMPAEEH
ncbi:redox-sensitive transcriptional activator SoxR [Pseudovibrio sp. WM33]|uniref:redox-sensitive transcriptional activator SoxR n=1 Tax=Pseudovibrio sp. WM33 TaxID=1735585 RepID=UPI0007AEE444|nr:redox-sensitive transcriptional activator SoxR [Pseudovibrio sp. WM33]KZL27868.1 Redox-sensitive transcriptional activator SoxR [Pseudovibrio sp. WM33]